MSGDTSMRPAKRLKMLSDDEDDSTGSDGSDGSNGDILNEAALTVNKDYAQKFEHNKMRDELQRLEDKYGRKGQNRGDSRNVNGSSAKAYERAPDDLSDSDSTSESEDDEGDLVTQELDSEINATLRAIRSKDPRVYDKQSTFYQDEDAIGTKEQNEHQQKDKPLYVKDYHRQNLMSAAEDEDQSGAVLSHMNQDELQKQALIKQMHAVQDGEGDSDSEAEENQFFKSKPVEKLPREREEQKTIDPSAADQDPETFLSNFMESRAWVPQDKVEYHPFDSDEDEYEDKADEFEAAYNLRFEDPTRSNDKLMSHSRQAAAQYSVRRDEPKGRKRARDLEREEKEAAKREREEERARLRNLRVEQAAAKLEQFKAASGLRGEALSSEGWQGFVDAGWDSDTWDKEMAKRFGDQYYAIQAEDDSDTNDKPKSKRKHLKKPKWEDDIDIGDLVPDFGAESDGVIALSDDENEQGQDDRRAMASKPILGNTDALGNVSTHSKAKIKGGKRAQVTRQARVERKKESRKERRKLEAAVDQKLSVDTVSGQATKKPTGPFRYRDTSPSAFGLSARDILMAEDSSLNQYAGLKKLAAFRDADKKQKDKKKLSKTARLRKWRRETFGNEIGPQLSLPDYIKGRIPGGDEPIGTAMNGAAGGDGPTAVDRKKKSKKRSRKKTASAEA